LKSKYYAVKLNAEDPQNIIFKNKVYKFDDTKNVSSLVSEWLGTRFGYPTTVYLDEKLNVIGKLSGFYEAKDYVKVLTYYDKELYKKNIDIEQYLKSAASNEAH
jgi:thioredoxin-related protein